MVVVSPSPKLRVRSSVQCSAVGVRNGRPRALVSVACVDAEKEKLIRAARDVARKIAFTNSLASKEYVDHCVADLENRLKGWPPLPSHASQAEASETLARVMEQTSSTAVVQRQFELGDTGALLLVTVEKEGTADEGNQRFCFRFYSTGPVSLHWGVEGQQAGRFQKWLLPPDILRPDDTTCTAEACTTPLKEAGLLHMTTVDIPGDGSVTGLSFVINHTQTNTWFKARDGKDFFVPVCDDHCLHGLAQERNGVKGDPSQPDEHPSADGEGEGVELSDFESLLNGVQYDASVLFWNVYHLAENGRGETPSGRVLATLRSEKSECRMEALYRIEFITDMSHADNLKLHWGYLSYGDNDSASSGRGRWSERAEFAVENWTAPSEDSRPANSECDGESCDTVLDNEGLLRRAIISVIPDTKIASINFVFQDEDAWYKPIGQESGSVPVPYGMMQRISDDISGTEKDVNLFPLGRNGASGHLLVISDLADDGDGNVTIDIFADAADTLVLHWGFFDDENEWIVPGTERTPAGSLSLARSSETPFTKSHDTIAKFTQEDSSDGNVSLQSIELSFGKEVVEEVEGLIFVLRSVDHDCWYKNQWSNFRVKFAESHSTTIEKI